MIEFVYAGVGIVLLLTLLFIFRNKLNQNKKINYILVIAFIFIFLGIFFNDKPAIGYTFLALGASIAIIERIRSRRKS
ncbi:hypothetical protein [Psychroflexus salis]|uniref:Uncharacterized protein n=1 Tax=Psychroflexus salis TaxID=1526574 RepID=A0A916ZR58_9FLAO|nr:hypothetical protein [Psychroflexus salis]GGE10032.1 hypothetical protein GCM10010831_09420 [Psychroflexus salis]